MRQLMKIGIVVSGVDTDLICSLFNKKQLSSLFPDLWLVVRLHNTRYFLNDFILSSFWNGASLLVVANHLGPAMTFKIHHQN